MSFHSDLAFGKLYEHILLDYIDYDEVEFAPAGVFSDYDVKIKRDGLEGTYEVKADRLSAKTGNLCIEYQCNEKPSGIASTKALYYAYFVVKGGSHDCYIIPVEELKKMIEDGKFRKGATDYGRTRFFLIPKTVFTPYIAERKQQP